MVSRREWIVTAAVGLAAGVAGYAFNARRVAPEPAAGADAEALLRLSLPDLENRPTTIGDWRGKVLVVNFWATWCEPCREEIPLFVKLQNEHGPRGLQFVGIAIDQPDKVRPFAAEYRMNFPVLIGGMEMIEVGRKLGNRAGVLPFTVVLRRDGTIAASAVGAAKPETLEPLLTALL